MRLPNVPGYTISLSVCNRIHFFSFNIYTILDIISYYDNLVLVNNIYDPYLVLSIFGDGNTLMLDHPFVYIFYLIMVYIIHTTNIKIKFFVSPQFPMPRSKFYPTNLFRKDSLFLDVLYFVDRYYRYEVVSSSSFPITVSRTLPSYGLVNPFGGSSVTSTSSLECHSNITFKLQSVDCQIPPVYNTSQI